jgi:hypothetical protein
MGYAKGVIDLGSRQDAALLQQVLRSKHATHDQLWQFFQLQTQEKRRRIFNWRMSRLVQHGLVFRTTAAFRSRTWLYSISENGAAHLAGQGDGAALVAGKATPQRDDHAVLHSLDLNNIQLKLMRSGELRRWKSELEILCVNELTGFGYAKDYDAIVTVGCGDIEATFALEYERQPKAPSRYRQVRHAIEKEQHVTNFLYLMPSYELLSYVAGFFNRCAKAVHFGILSEFEEQGLHTKVLDHRRTISVPLHSVLVPNGR